MEKQKRVTVKARLCRCGNTEWLAFDVSEMYTLAKQMEGEDVNNMNLTLHVGELPPDPRSNEGLKMAAEEWCRRFNEWQQATYGDCEEGRNIVLADNGGYWRLDDSDGEILGRGYGLDCLIEVLARRPAPKPRTVAEEFESLLAQPECTETGQSDYGTRFNAVGDWMRKQPDHIVVAWNSWPGWQHSPLQEAVTAILRAYLSEHGNVPVEEAK